MWRRTSLPFLRSLQRNSLRFKISDTRYNASSTQLSYIRRVDAVTNLRHFLPLFEEWIGSKEKPSIRVCNRMLYRFSGEAKFAEMSCLFEQMTSLSYEPDLTTYQIMINCYAKLGRVSHAFSLLNQMEEKGFLPNTGIYGTLINSFSSIGSFPTVDILVETMKQRNIPLDIVAYNSIIRGILEQKNVDIVRMEKTIKEMEETSLTKTFATYCYILRCYMKNQNYDKAEKILNNCIKKFGENTSVDLFNHFLHGITLFTCDKKAKEIVGIMKELNITWNQFTYNSIIDIYSQMNNLEMVRHYQDEMARTGFTPDKYTYRTAFKLTSANQSVKETMESINLIQRNDGQSVVLFIISKLNTLVRAQKVLDAYNLFLKLLKEPHIPITVLMYNILITGLLRQKMFLKAFDLFAIMREDVDAQPDGATFSLIIKAKGQAGTLVHVQNVHEHLKSSKGSYIQRDVNILNALMHAYGNCKAGGEVMKVYREYLSDGIYPNQISYNTALSAFIKSNAFGHLFTFIDEMPPSMFEGITYSILINCALNKRELPRVKTKLLDFTGRTGLEVAHKLKNHALDRGIKAAQIFTPILSRYARDKTPKLMRDELNVMEQNQVEFSVETFNILVSLYARTGDMDSIHEVFRRMKLVDKHPNCRSFVPIIYWFTEQGDMENAMKWFARLKKETKDGHVERHVYVMLIDGYSKIQDKATVAKIESEMKQLGFHPPVYSGEYIRRLNKEKRLG